MEPTVEQRLNFLEDRVKALEGLAGVGSAPVRPPQPFPPAPPPQRQPAAQRRPARDLEEILGGRVLGWVGGIAVVIAAVFFVVMAVRKGWIGEAGAWSSHSP